MEQFTLEDRYLREDGTVYLSGVQALVRMLFDRVRHIPPTRAEVMSRGPLYLLYLILDPLIDSCFPFLHQIEQQIAHVETRIFGGEMHQAVYEISMIRREIIAFRHVVRPEVGVPGLVGRDPREVPALRGLAHQKRHRRGDGPRELAECSW